MKQLKDIVSMIIFFGLIAPFIMCLIVLPGAIVVWIISFVSGDKLNTFSTIIGLAVSCYSTFKLGWPFNKAAHSLITVLLKIPIIKYPLRYFLDIWDDGIKSMHHS